MEKLNKAIHYLIYLFVFLIPFQTRWIYQQATVKGTPFEYGSLSIYASEILLAIIIVLGIIFLVPKIKKATAKVKPTRLRNIVIFLLIIMFFATNILLAINSELAYYKLTTLLLATCFFFIIVATKPKLINLAWAFVLSGFVQSAAAIYQFMEQKIIANKWLGMAAQDPAILGTPVVETVAGRWLRTFGTFPHPNMLAGFLVICLLLVLYLAFHLKSKKQQRQVLMIFVVSTLALMTTLSRAGILTFIICLLVYAFLTRKNNEQNKIITKFALIALAILIIFTVTYPELIMNRVGSGTHVEQTSNTTRLSQYAEYPQIIKSDWLFGVGLGNYTIVLQNQNPELRAWDYQPIHNTFLLIISEIGIVISSLLILILIWNFKKIRKLDSLSMVLLLAIGLLLFFDHYWWSFYSGIMMLIFCLAVIRLHDRSKE